MFVPTNENEVCEAVLSLPAVRVRGGGTKGALSAGATLSTATLAGMLEYEPGEFTFTALAGTPLSVVRDALAANGQYLPFDPPLVEAGATLGGTVASGLSGPGRFQFGGVRDFLLGVRIVTGDGRVVRGGGKVVKNAAGFDIPKLMVGSLGRLGVITEVTFKVFPAPAATATILADFARLEDAVAMLEHLAASRLALMALDLERRAGTRPSLRDGARPPFSPLYRLSIRVGGLRDALLGRLARVREFVASAATIEAMEIDKDYWQAVTEFSWVPADHALVKLPLTAAQIPQLESALETIEPTVVPRYSVGGNVAWIAWPTALERSHLANIATRLGRPCLVVRDSATRALSAPCDNLLFQKLRGVFDPQNKFSPSVG